MIKIEETDRKRPLLWVHHDAKNREALPNRPRVFSHIQGVYRPWKRRELNKSLRNRRATVKTARDDPSKEVQPKSPQTLIAKGNSDPFDVYPIKIGAQENDLVSFYRDFFLPAQYGMRLRIPKVDLLRARDWEDCISGLTDEGVAHGLFGRWGHMVSRCTPRMHAAAMEHQYRSTQLLRKKVSSGHRLQTFSDFMHLNHLFSAETISRNAYGASTHGRMLQRMFEEAWRRGTVDFKLLIWQVHNDVQTSIMFLVRPIFDVDDFLPKLYASLKTAAALESPSLDHETNDLDPSVQGGLAELFTECRNFWQEMTIRETQGITDLVSPEIMVWHVSQELLFIGRFVNHYVNVKEWMDRGVTEVLKKQLLIQQCLALAGVYLVRSLNLNPVVLGVPIFDAAPSVLTALRAALEESDRIFDEADHHKYANAKLWTLYVGAMAEQGFPMAETNPCEQWFNISLAEKALDMGLHSWGEVKGVFLRFLYNDRVPPNGALWFQMTITCYWEQAESESSPRDGDMTGASRPLKYEV